jgi:hypothetical protein
MVVKEASFTSSTAALFDYLRAGLQINVQFGIDYTASNGAATKSSSLHYTPGNGWSQYEQAIMSVAPVVLDFDADKMVDVYGFGAILCGNQVSTSLQLPLE